MQNTKFLIRSLSFSSNTVERSNPKINIFIDNKGGFILKTENLFTFGEIQRLIRYLKKFISSEKIQYNFKRLPNNCNYIKDNFNVNIKVTTLSSFSEERSLLPAKEIKILYWVTNHVHYKLDFLNRTFSRKDLNVVITELEKIQPKWMSFKNKKNNFNLIHNEELPQRLKHLEKGDSLVVGGIDLI